ncbi:MAG: 50S ribosomal protein L3, partial [Nanoarchaeota archaeon]|nr:50S ribosomal protein L3 [Nanoarchaeota archaeon]
RKRAKKSYARIRSWPETKEPKLLGFIGYKAGMVHKIAINNNKNSHMKGEEIAVPATIVECPPLKILSVRFYKIIKGVLQVEKEIFFKTEKNLKRKTNVSKDNSKELETLDFSSYDNITVLVYSQPEKTTIGKKKPEVVEMGLGGSNEDKINYVKNNFDKEIVVDSVFSENQMIDIHAITKGQGYQGPVKRFGIGLKSHKSEKGIRAPGSLGPWNRHQHIMWRVAHAGQTGFHQRIDYNKQILKLSNEILEEEKNIHKYGSVKSTYLLLHGSIPGPKKRTLVMTAPMREKKKKHQLTIEE